MRKTKQENQNAEDNRRGRVEEVQMAVARRRDQSLYGNKRIPIIKYRLVSNYVRKVIKPRRSILLDPTSCLYANPNNGSLA